MVIKTNVVNYSMKYYIENVLLLFPINLYD